MRYMARALPITEYFELILHFRRGSGRMSLNDFGGLMKYDVLMIGESIM